MPSRRLFANWSLRATCYLIIIVCGLATAAHAQQPEAQVGVSSLLSWALGALGALTALIVAIWSKNQDRRIEDVRRIAEDAMRVARSGRDDLLGRYRPAEEHERAIERAIKPVADDVASMKKDLKHVERMLTRVQSVSGRHPILDVPDS